MKPLVLTTEPLPLPGLPTTGAGLRAWSLFFGLRAAGFPDAEIAFAADSVRGRDVPLDAVPGVHVFERERLGDFVAKRRPDAIVLQHWGLASALPPVSVPLAIDLAGPHLLERQLWGSRDPAKDRREKLAALARADFVTCSGRLQRAWFLPFLLEAGFEPTGDLCPVIPFSLAPDLPSPAEDRDTAAFLFAGYFLPWQDPAAALDWTLDCMDKRDRGSLVVVGGPHPSGDVSGGRHDALLARLREHERVEIHGVMPFAQMLGVMRRCGAVVDLMPRNPERELAFPSRTLAAMWAGLPPLHNDYDELAEPIARAKAGWTLDPANEAAFRRAVERVLAHGEDVAQRGANAQKLVRRDYTWDKTIAPLAAWLGKPARREKKASVPAAAVEPAREGERPAARREKAPRPGGNVVYAPPTPVTGPNRLQQVLSPLALLLALPLAAVLLLVFGVAEAARALRGRR